MKNKKYILGMIFSLFIFVLFSNTALAKTKIIMNDGKAKFDFMDKLATTGVYYETVGWIIHKNDCNGNSYKTEPYGIAYQTEINKATHKDDPSVYPGYIKTYFEISREEISNAMLKAKMGEWQSAKTIYMDSIFEVKDKDGNVLGTYYTLDEIKNAQPWANPSSLDNYFDVPVTYKSTTFPFTVEYQLEDGTVLATDDLGKYESGIDKNFSFPKIKDNYIIKESYIQSIQNGEIQKKKTEDSKDWEFKTLVGGTKLVGVYKGIDVTVNFLDINTKQSIQEPYTTVEPTNKEFEYVFPNELEYNGEIYQFVKFNSSAYNQEVDENNVILTTSDKPLTINGFYKKNTSQQGDKPIFKAIIAVKDLDTGITHTEKTWTSELNIKGEKPWQLLNFSEIPDESLVDKYRFQVFHEGTLLKTWYVQPFDGIENVFYTAHKVGRYKCVLTIYTIEEVTFIVDDED